MKQTVTVTIWRGGSHVSNDNHMSVAQLWSGVVFYG